MLSEEKDFKEFSLSQKERGKKKSNMDLFLLCQEKELYASGFKAEQAVTDEAAAVC